MVILTGEPTAAVCQWIPPREPVVVPKRPRLVITVATGRALDALKITGPRMEAYAKRCKADFRVIDSATQSWPLAEKFRLAHYGAPYQRVLYLDADVFVRDRAPNIFNAYPAGRIVAHDDMVPGHEHWLLAEQRELARSQGVDIPWGCINSGVVLFDGADANIWQGPPLPFGVTHCAEQNWVQRSILRTGRYLPLGTEWNFQWWMHPAFEGVEKAHFVHLSGMGRAHPEMIAPMLRALELKPAATIANRALGRVRAYWPRRY